MSDKLNIVELIERNPLTRFNNEYSNRFVDKIKLHFESTEQQMFLASFYTYLNYNSEKDFVINLDNIWKWLGFSRKDHCKTVLVKYFIENIDYKINNELDIEQPAPATSGAGFYEKETTKKNLGGAGLNKESIILNIRTFKKLCLKSNTKRADSIHDYYIKLEEILQEILTEEAKDLQTQLQLKEDELLNKEVLLKKKDKQIKELSKKVDENYIYVAINEGVSNLAKIGITDNILRRNDQHLTSNPGFKYIYTHKSKNNKLIESCVKAILSPFIYNKAEWYSIDANDLIYLVEFLINIYDRSDGISDPKNITDYIKNFGNKKVILVQNKDDFIPKQLYHEYFTQCIEFQPTTGHVGKMDNKYKCPLIRLQEDFDKWLTQHDYSFPIKNENGNYYEKYKLDIQNYIGDTYNKQLETINLICGKNNMRMTSYLGYIGFRIRADFASHYYDHSTYSKFVNNCLEIDNKTNTTKREIVQYFREWCKNNGIISPKESQICERSTSFYEELTKSIEKLTRIQAVPKVSNKIYNGYPGFRGIKLISKKILL